MNPIKSKSSLFILIGPGFIFLTLFLFVPLLFVLSQSLQNADGGITISRYVEEIKDQQFQIIFIRTLRMALIVTPLAVLIGYPTAYYISKLKGAKKSVLISLVILPLMTSPVARTYSWIVMLGRFGIVNSFLTFMHFQSEPTRLLYTEGAIIIGLLQLFLPIMILTISSALENVSEDVEEAALSLGSNRIGVFFRVVIPLSFEGFIMGVTLVFTGCFTAYVTPAILGGAKVLTLSTLMREEALVLMNWEAATVIAVVMIITTLVLYNGIRHFRPRNLV